MGCHEVISSTIAKSSCSLAISQISVTNIYAHLKDYKHIAPGHYKEKDGAEGFQYVGQQSSEDRIS